MATPIRSARNSTVSNILESLVKLRSAPLRVERTVRNPVTEEHHRTCRIVLSRHPRQPSRIWALAVDRLSPFVRCGVLILLSVDQLPARDSPFTEGDSGQIDQVQRFRLCLSG